MFRKAAGWVFVVAVCTGCHSATAPDTSSAPPKKPATMNAGAQTAPGTGGSNTNPGILPLGGGALSPVTNPGAVDGAGSGVNEAAKSMAKNAAANAGKSSADQAAGGE